MDESRIKKAPDRKMTTAEAVEYLKHVHGLTFKPNGLRVMRYRKNGPEFVRINSLPYYPQSKLDSWANGEPSSV